MVHLKFYLGDSRLIRLRRDYNKAYLQQCDTWQIEANLSDMFLRIFDDSF